MPQTQKVGMRYTTRVRIDPAAANSSQTTGIGSAADLAYHTICWNNLNDPDHSSVTATHGHDGARNHQPLMYDQYGMFYNMMTVIGARAKITFTANDRVIQTHVYAADGHTVTGQTQQVSDPVPCYVGFLTSNEHRASSTPAINFDEANERRQIKYKRLVDQDKPQTLYAKWSLRKETARQTGLMTKPHVYSETWGGEFGHDVDSFNTRYLHIVAHPCTLSEAAGFKDPAPVDVQIDMDYIVLLSDRKDIGQSN